ncbi:putative heme/steroid binding protein [Xanthobacter flavus]|uniref:Heme/steroid binding protein n=1 Tax=Xanthobacter flavus TaxID=281 RepID=A0A9W6CQL8_XANFL|nr:hypothetical protein [Xanthobacter flavus]MDR6334483.1 putative heme/steroid binding protein [Xanthobacter flavus]GLI23497.1 hypothetical protein XFLAVUS301_31710 [Xanthobacter flavus]
MVTPVYPPTYPDTDIGGNAYAGGVYDAIAALWTGLAEVTASIGSRLLPAGGNTGYVLAKSSAADYAVQWVALPGGGDMLRSTYDPNADGIIAVANGGTGGNSQSTGRAGLQAQQDVGYVQFLEIGGSLATGNRVAYIDFHAQDSTDYEFRIIRNSGPNGDVSLLQRGDGNIAIQTVGAGIIYMNAAGGFNLDTAGYFNLNGKQIWTDGRVQTLSTADKYLPHYVTSPNDGVAAARFSYSESAYLTAARIASSTSLAFGTGTKVFTIASGLTTPVVGKVVTIKSATAAGTAYMVGTITSYSGTTLTCSITTCVGSGTYADWTIQVAYDRYAVHIVDRSAATGSGHYAETSYALGLSRIKPNLAIEGQTSGLGIFVKGGYTGSRDYSAAGYSAGDTAAIQGQAWLEGDLTSFGAWEEARFVLNAGGGATVSGSGTWAAGRIQILAGRWNGLTDYFGGKINGVIAIAEELSNVGVAFYAGNGSAGSWTYAFGTSSGAYIEMNGTVHTVSDPDSKDGLAIVDEASRMLSVVTGTDLCSWTYRDEAAHGPAPRRLGVSSRNAGSIKGLSDVMEEAGFDPRLAVTRPEGCARDAVNLNAQVALLWGAVQALARENQTLKTKKVLQ